MYPQRKKNLSYKDIATLVIAHNDNQETEDDLIRAKTVINILVYIY